jgi:hypothetical protein
MLLLRCPEVYLMRCPTKCQLKKNNVDAASTTIDNSNLLPVIAGRPHPLKGNVTSPPPFGPNGLVIRFADTNAILTRPCGQT